MQTYEIHPAATIFPEMDAASFAHLKEDIQAYGLREKITLYDGKILDGRHRYRACVEIGIEPEFYVFTEGDPLAYVISVNLHRRHLNESQRAMVGARIASLPVGRPELNGPIGPFNISQPEAAEKMNVGTRTVKRAKRVLDQGTDEVIAAVDSGEVTLKKAEDIVQLPKPEQNGAMAERKSKTKATGQRRPKSQPKPAPIANGELPDLLKAMRKIRELTKQALRSVSSTSSASWSRPAQFEYLNAVLLIAEKFDR